MTVALRGDPERDVTRGVRDVQAVVDSVRSGTTTTPDELLAALRLLGRVRAVIDTWEPVLVGAARAQSTSWAALAAALGLGSRQAAERRFLRLNPSSTGEETGEGRVRAARVRRAGDRAVAGWARDNARSLRRLAGQVGGLQGLRTAGQRSADRVLDALADDDPAALLGPLANSHEHVRTEHAALAEQIHAVGERTALLRRRAGDGGSGQRRS